MSDYVIGGLIAVNWTRELSVGDSEEGGCYEDSCDRSARAALYNMVTLWKPSYMRTIEVCDMARVSMCSRDVIRDSDTSRSGG